MINQCSPEIDLAPEIRLQLFPTGHDKTSGAPFYFFANPSLDLLPSSDLSRYQTERWNQRLVSRRTGDVCGLSLRAYAMTYFKTMTSFGNSCVLKKDFWPNSLSSMADNADMADNSREGKLAVDLEGDSLLRNRARVKGVLLVWPSAAATGIPSMKACDQNVRALELLALWWVQCSDVPTSIPVDALRIEAIQKIMKTGPSENTLELEFQTCTGIGWYLIRSYCCYCCYCAARFRNGENSWCCQKTLGSSTLTVGG